LCPATVENGKINAGTNLGCFRDEFENRILQGSFARLADNSRYSNHLQTGHPNIRQIKKPDLFVYGYQMVFYNPISSLVFKCTASLNLF
jgi:hypothetical protein